MAWSFRKRIKIAPGVHLNIGKNGVSTTVGKRGASVTFGKNGTYMNTSIPGTGLRYRSKISGNKKQTSSSSYYSGGGDTSSCTSGCIYILLFLVAVFFFYLGVDTFQNDEDHKEVAYFFFGVGAIALFIVVWALVSNLVKQYRSNHPKKEKVEQKPVQLQSTEVSKKPIEPANNQIAIDERKTMSRSEYNAIVADVERLYVCLQSFEKNTRIMSAVNTLVPPSPEDFGFTINNGLALVSLHDLICCYKSLGYDIYDDRQESVGLTIFILKLMKSDVSAIIAAPSVVLGKGKEIASNVLKAITFNAPDDKLIIYELFKEKKLSRRLVEKYVSALYCLSATLMKVDGEVSPEEAKFIKYLSDAIDALYVVEEKPKKPKPVEKPAPDLKDTEGKLKELIGLGSVKEEVMKLTSFVKIQQVRKERGLAVSPMSYHCVFTGNPGTGKTTVARILAEIYRDLGVLSKGHLVETDRSGLVAEYVGQTAVKTSKVVDSAIGGVLFIDEAYSLVQGGSNDYGMEAISTLLKRMEDDRDKLVVILAGYGNEMKTFIDSNPGLQSRFNRYIHFDDYSAADLFDIFKLNVKKYDYSLDKAAEKKARALFENAVANKDKNFGNGRYARNVFEKVMENQSVRLASQSDITQQMLQVLVEADIPDWQ